MGYEITLSGKMINYIWPSRKLAQTCFKISTSSLSLEQIQDMWLYTFTHAQTPSSLHSLCLFLESEKPLKPMTTGKPGRCSFRLGSKVSPSNPNIHKITINKILLFFTQTPVYRDVLQHCCIQKF